MRKDDRHLENRKGRWYYQRRVPKRFKAFDDRGVIKTALKTDSIEVARFRRDALEAADDDYWNSLLYLEDGEVARDAGQRLRDTLERRYRAASSRALARGFVYAPIEHLVDKADLGELIDRINVVKPMGKAGPSRAEQIEAEAMLGTVQSPPVTVSAAFHIYCTDIAADELVGKSPTQIEAWRKTKKRGIQYFINVVGDKPIREITRQDALQYYNWWKDRVIPINGQSRKKLLSTKTANRDLGNMRKLCGEYFKHIGEEDRQNPFRNLSFKDKLANTVPPFEDQWVREKILVPGLFKGVPGDAEYLIYALIETGCRPSEIANLLEDDIHLDVNVPYISIRPRENRQIKTASSIRDIPLIGISLKAMQHAPQGFPKYRDQPNLLSANLMKAFKARSLFPTPDHKIYSFRHSFEKRMQEAELDYGFRCMIMGHRNTRPAYGDGGSMEYRRDQLLKIVHPFSEEVFTR